MNLGRGLGGLGRLRLVRGELGFGRCICFVGGIEYYSFVRGMYEGKYERRWRERMWKKKKKENHVQAKRSSNLTAIKQSYNKNRSTRKENLSRVESFFRKPQGPINLSSKKPQIAYSHKGLSVVRTILASTRVVPHPASMRRLVPRRIRTRVQQCSYHQRA